MKLIDLLKEISATNAVTEEDIAAAIESLNAAAVASGFRLVKKNTKPGKSSTTHATWIEESGKPLRVSLVWTKPKGLFVVASYQVQPTPEQMSVGIRPYDKFIYGAPEEWLNPKKWEEIEPIES